LALDAAQVAGWISDPVSKAKSVIVTEKGRRTRSRIPREALLSFAPVVVADPLTKSQQALRGKKVADMTDAQLRDRLDACAKMELHVKPAKARRSWKSAAREAQAELHRRDGQAHD
jgi:hypothetical protein